MQLSTRVLQVNPLIYSFFAGVVVSLAGNIYSAASLSPAGSLSGSKSQFYFAAVLLGISAVFFFFAGMQLDAIRAIQLSMKNPPDPNDFSLLLADPKKSRPIEWTLFLAGMTLMLSILILSLHW